MAVSFYQIIHVLLLLVSNMLIVSVGNKMYIKNKEKKIHYRHKKIVNKLGGVLVLITSMF